MRDPINYERVAEIVGRVEPSRQTAALHDAWREYAANAARPYTWKTFELYAKRHLIERRQWAFARDQEQLSPWDEATPASPRVLVIGPHAAIRVRGGALEIVHGPHDNRTTIKIDIDADPKPRAILFDSHGEFFTGEALRWCARYAITLAWPGGPDRLITTIETALEARAPALKQMRDIDAAVIRAQCAADPARIAREIVRAKISTELKATLLDAEARQRETSVWNERLDAAKAVAEIVTIEGVASRQYWRAFRGPGLRERKSENLPKSWLRFDQRSKSGANCSNQHAAHPISAMLNYAYVVEAGRLAKALACRGLCLSIGFLHGDKIGRNSLVWDALEPLRPAINARIFSFIAKHEFSRSDFPQAGVNVFRLSRRVIQLLLHDAALPEREIQDAAKFIEGLILSPALKEKSSVEAPNELSADRARRAVGSDSRRRANGDRASDQTAVEPTAKRRTVASQRAGKQMDGRDRPMV